MVYLFDSNEEFTQKHMFRYRALLSRQRADKVRRLRYPEDKKQSALAYLLLRAGLLEQYHMTSAPELGIGEGGRPELKGPGPCISLSHCKCGVMCAVSEQKIGVDIQEHVRTSPELLEEVFTLRERQEIEREEHRFTDLWALKESYGKFTGAGILYRLDRFGFEEIREDWRSRFGCLHCCVREKDYSCAVSAGSRERIQKVSLSGLLTVLERLL